MYAYINRCRRSNGTGGVLPTLPVNVIERSAPFLYPVVIDGNAQNAVNQ